MLGTLWADTESETRRLAALREYGLLDTGADEALDRLTAMAAGLFNVPIVLISLVDADRQFFKSRVGLPVCELDRETSFCTHAIMQDDVFVVTDATRDPRFATSPLVLGPPFIRFYAGKTLIAPSGERIGSLCLVDTEPNHPFSDADAANLRTIASLAMAQMEMRRLDHAQDTGRARFENIAATSPDAIICARETGHVTFWNRAAERLFGHAAGDFADRPLAALVAERWRGAFEAELDRLSAGGSAGEFGQTVEFGALHHDGREFPAEFSFSAWTDGGARHVGVIVRDASEHRRTEERLFRLASLDQLTDLPNRAAWRDAITRAFLAGTPFTVMLLDLDGFKRVNDTLGHHAGDVLIREVAGRLQAACTPEGLVARLGGDEFGVLLPGADANHATSLAILLIRSVSEPCTIGAETAEVGLSVGIAFAPEHGRQPDEMCGAADLALYRAKGSGRGRFEIFSPTLREVADSQRSFERELRRAFAAGEFELHYQTRIGLAHGRATGAEALMRWNHGRRGVLGPEHFLDALGRDSSAAAVGAWALRTACREAASWREAAPDLQLAVNLFAAQLRTDSLPDLVRDALAESGWPPEALELEIAAALFERDDPVLIRRLHRLRDLGVGLVFDNAGMAAAPLSIFRHVPVTRLAIDRTLVRGIDTEPAQAAIVGALLQLGRGLGIAVTAKGVETDGQRQALLACGCTDAQGHLWGRAAPAADFSRALRQTAG